jgi:hypothetical protein
MQNEQKEVQFHDVVGGNVEVIVGYNGKSLWINLDGMCAFRVGRADSITVEDLRTCKVDKEIWEKHKDKFTDKK